MSRTPFLFALLLVLLLCLVPSCAAFEGLYDMSDLSEEQLQALPDENSAADRTKLMCNACHWFVVELFGAVQKMQQRLVKPKQHHVDDLFEEFCPAVTPKYGLHVDKETRLPKLKFTSLTDQLSGGWWTKMFENQCSEFADGYLSNDKRRTWKHLQGLWAGKKTIDEKEFLKLCPICSKKDAAGGYPSRETGAMWVDEQTRLIEDWDL